VAGGRAGAGARRAQSDRVTAPPLAAAIESTSPGLHDLLRRLIAFRTESQAKEATHFPVEARRCIDFVADFLSELGFAVEGWDVGPSATFDAHPLIVARRPGTGGGRSIAFNGHVDVVPVGDSSGWSQDPFGGAIVDGRLYGRGAADMKGGIAAALWATRTALEAGLDPRGDISFHIVSDEEVVGNGTRAIVERAPVADVVVSVEPTELAMCVSEGGLVHFRIEVEGVEAHASTRYLSVHAGGKRAGGVNAVEKAIKVIVALQELEREWAVTKSHPILPAGYDTLLPGIIVGGPGGGKDGRLNLFSNAGTTPNYCSVEYNLWFYPDESFEDVKAEVESYVANVCRADPWLREHPPRFTWKIGHIYFPPLDLSLDHPAVQATARALEAVGLDPVPRGFGAATDLAWYGERRLPGLICGPGRLEQCHVADEYIDTDALIQAAKVYGLLLADWCA
jgi:acetylornithine deacetylase/succinyl-diaminopimelate desuccinylase family protein